MNHSGNWRLRACADIGRRARNRACSRQSSHHGRDNIGHTLRDEFDVEAFRDFERLDRVFAGEKRDGKLRRLLREILRTVILRRGKSGAGDEKSE